MTEAERVELHREMNKAFTALLSICTENDLPDIMHGNLCQQRDMMGSIIDFKCREDANESHL